MHKHLALALLLAVTGCGKSSDTSGAAAPSTKTAEPAVAPPAAKQPLTAAFFGKRPAVPPGELAKIKPGIPKEEAAKLSPLATKATSEPTDLEGLSLAVQGTNHGVDLLVTLPAAKAGLIEEAWGPGAKADRGGTPVTVWFDAEAGIRAALSVDATEATLRFEPYTPLATLLGPGKDLAFLASGFAGKTKDELGALYPALVSGKYLALPATEWAFGGDISLSPYPMSGPIESLAFEIPFASPEGKAEILKVLEAKWGAPKDDVYGGQKVAVYNKAPRVQVSEGPTGLTVRVLAK